MIDSPQAVVIKHEKIKNTSTVIREFFEILAGNISSQVKPGEQVHTLPGYDFHPVTGYHPVTHPLAFPTTTTSNLHALRHQPAPPHAAPAAEAPGA